MVAAELLHGAYKSARVGFNLARLILFIAAIVIANRGVLITHNVNEVSRIKRLSMEDWSELT